MFDTNKNVHLIADVVEIEKDEKGHVGIAIGGGAPYCPNLYIVQIFDNSPAKAKGLLSVGDEIVAVNGKSVKGCEKNAVAAMIRQAEDTIRISFNRIQFEPDTLDLDILLKKFKHRLVDSMDAETADALGFSRAILCNDVLAQLQTRLDRNQQFYRTMIKKAEEMLRCYQQMAQSQETIGATLAEMAAKERSSSEEEETGGQETLAKTKATFAQIAKVHKSFGKEHRKLAQYIGGMVRALHCHANAAIPDVRQSLNKYIDAKYEYLSYCLRAKELEDEEAETATNGERLPRMETGNYEYRITLRNREQSRGQFMEKRKQVAVKIELLDEKHVRELALQLKNFMDTMKTVHVSNRDELAETNQ